MCIADPGLADLESGDVSHSRLGTWETENPTIFVQCVAELRQTEAAQLQCHLRFLQVITYGDCVSKSSMKKEPMMTSVLPDKHCMLANVSITDR